MDYVEFCHLLLKTADGLERCTPHGRRIGVRLDAVLQELRNTVNPQDLSIFDQAFHDAYKDLAYGAYFFDPSIVKRGFLLLSQDGRLAARYPEEIWKGVCASAILEEEEDRLLIELNRLSGKTVVPWPALEWVAYPEVAFALGLQADEGVNVQVEQLIAELENIGFIKLWPYADSDNRTVSATYLGLVWTTRREKVFDWEWIDSLVEDWETCTVDFKRQLYLRTKDEKAEFVKDAIALANTQASGKRWMVIGFDDKTREQFVPSDPIARRRLEDHLVNMRQEQLEQILSSYSDPPVRIALRHVNYRKGLIAVLDIHRESRLIPHRVSKRIHGEKKNLDPGDTFVRHGSIAEPPTPAELQALEEERSYARAKFRRYESAA